MLVVTGAVPVPVAGDAMEEPEADDDEEDDAVEPLDDAPEGFSRLCIAAVSCVLTRFKAVSLAILARPFPR